MLQGAADDRSVFLDWDCQWLEPPAWQVGGGWGPDMSSAV